VLFIIYIEMLCCYNNYSYLESLKIDILYKKNGLRLYISLIARPINFFLALIKFISNLVYYI
jgi:hypothetical protein